MKWFKSILFKFIYKIIIACRPVVTGGFPQEKKAIAAKLGGQPHEAS
jgi:hypothetical protein